MHGAGVCVDRADVTITTQHACTSVGHNNQKQLVYNIIAAVAIISSSHLQSPDPNESRVNKTNCSYRYL